MPTFQYPLLLVMTKRQHRDFTPVENQSSPGRAVLEVNAQTLTLVLPHLAQSSHSAMQSDLPLCSAEEKARLVQHWPKARLHQRVAIGAGRVIRPPGFATTLALGLQFLEMRLPKGVQLAANTLLDVLSRAIRSDHEV